MVSSSKFGRVLVLALAVGLGVPLTANAAFTLTLSSGSSSQVFSDTNGDGIIAVDVNDFNGFSFYGDFATSNAPNTDGGPAVLTLSQASVRNWWDGGLRQLVITIEDTGFAAPSGQVDITTRLAALDLLGNGDVTTTSYLNNVAVGSVALTQTGLGQDSVSTTIGASPYTLRSVTTINLGRAGILLSSGSTEVSSQSQQLSPVPAPATAVMALAGVPVLGAFGWLRRRGRQAPSAA